MDIIILRTVEPILHIEERLIFFMYVNCLFGCLYTCQVQLYVGVQVPRWNNENVIH